MRYSFVSKAGETLFTETDWCLHVKNVYEDISH